MRRVSRFFFSCVAGVLLAPLAVDAAWASDGGEDAAPITSLDATAITSLDATGPTDGATECIAIGEPCTTGQTCCNPEAYCGSFGGAGGARACGSNTSNELGTGSCSSAGSSSTDGVGFIGVLGLALGVGLHRRKRPRHG